MQAIRVAFADDHPVVLDGLCRFFSTLPRFQVVGRATSLSSLERLLSGEAVDVGVLDLDMPGMTGLTGFEALHRRFPATRWCIFTMQSEERLAGHYLSAGAAAFLNKGRSTDELVSAVERAWGGDLDLDRESPPHLSLSRREQEVLHLLLEGATTRKIARQLGVGTSTVHTYLERIKTKLDVASVAEVVAYGFRRGLIE